MPKRIDKRKMKPENCKVCRFKKEHPDFKLAVQNCSMFNPAGTETLGQTLVRYQAPFDYQVCYMHLKRHWKEQMAAREARRLNYGRPVVIHGVNTDILAAGKIDGEYEVSLDEFIRLGRAKLKRQEMPITATTFLQAIKIKSDSVLKSKDQKIDFLKAFASRGIDSGDASPADA